MDMWRDLEEVENWLLHLVNYNKKIIMVNLRNSNAIFSVNLKKFNMHYF